MFPGWSGHAPGVSWLCPSDALAVVLKDVLSMLLECLGCLPRVPRPHVPLSLHVSPFADTGFSHSQRTGWSSTRCGMSKATAVPSAAVPTATAGGSASPSWATTPTPTATRVGGSSAASSCPATGGSRGCWAGCSTHPPGAWMLPCTHLPHHPPSRCILTQLMCRSLPDSLLASVQAPWLWHLHCLSPSPHPPRGWGRPCSSASLPR